MNKIKFFSFIAMVTCALFLGCDSEKPTTKKADDAADNSTDSAEHVHDDGTVHKGPDHDEHAHGEGPHGGTVADWGGGKFHVEFTVDHGKQEATVYILGDDEKTPSPIDAEEITLAIKDPAFQLALKPSPQDGDPEGKASRFVGTHESLGIVMEYEGSMSGAVDGTPYSGNFKELAH